MCSPLSPPDRWYYGSAAALGHNPHELLSPVYYSDDRIRERAICDFFWRNYDICHATE